MVLALGADLERGAAEFVAFADAPAIGVSLRRTSSRIAL